MGGTATTSEVGRNVCSGVEPDSGQYHDITKLHLINKRLGLLEPALSPALRQGEEVVPVAGTAAVLEPAE